MIIDVMVEFLDYIYFDKQRTENKHTNLAISASGALFEDHIQHE